MISKGWKTFLAAIGIAALGAVQIYFQHGGAGLIPDQYVGPLLIGVGFAMAALRGVTDTPIFKSAPK